MDPTKLLIIEYVKTLRRRLKSHIIIPCASRSILLPHKPPTGGWWKYTPSDVYANCYADTEEAQRYIINTSGETPLSGYKLCDSSYYCDRLQKESEILKNHKYHTDIIIKTPNGRTYVASLLSYPTVDEFEKATSLGSSLFSNSAYGFKYMHFLNSVNLDDIWHIKIMRANKLLVANTIWGWYDCKDVTLLLKKQSKRTNQKELMLFAHLYGRHLDQSISILSNIINFIDDNKTRASVHNSNYGGKFYVIDQDMINALCDQ